METTTTTHANTSFLECLSPIQSVEDALDVIAASYEADTGLLLLDSRMLPPDFFDLRTRFAGEFLQKLQNYRIRIAGVFPANPAYSERFNEFLTEAKQGQTFRVFSSRDAALDWLTAS